jgi:hypothetical protein
MKKLLYETICAKLATLEQSAGVPLFAKSSIGWWQGEPENEDEKESYVKPAAFVEITQWDCAEFTLGQNVIKSQKVSFEFAVHVISDQTWRNSLGAADKDIALFHFTLEYLIWAVLQGISAGSQGTDDEWFRSVERVGVEHDHEQKEKRNVTIMRFRGTGVEKVPAVVPLDMLLGVNLQIDVPA